MEQEAAMRLIDADSVKDFSSQKQVEQKRLLAI